MKKDKLEIAVIFRPLSLWIGVHYSKVLKQTCINLVPMVTIRIRRRKYE